MTIWNGRTRSIRVGLLSLAAALLLATTSPPNARAQADPDVLGFRIHVLIRIPSSVPPDGKDMPDPGTSLVHTSTTAVDMETAIRIRNEWLQTGVLYQRAWYPAVTVWTTGADGEK
jgi:hypothetical protein